MPLAEYHPEKLNAGFEATQMQTNTKPQTPQTPNRQNRTLSNIPNTQTSPELYHQCLSFKSHTVEPQGSKALTTQVHEQDLWPGFVVCLSDSLEKVYTWVSTWVDRTENPCYILRLKKIIASLRLVGPRSGSTGAKANQTSRTQLAQNSFKTRAKLPTSMLYKLHKPTTLKL